MSSKADLTKLALDYHAHPTPGKISVVPTKSLANRDDLSLASSPRDAAACNAIFEGGHAEAALYTSRANLAAVVSNGPALLGLRDIGPLAAKPAPAGNVCLPSDVAT